MREEEADAPPGPSEVRRGLALGFCRHTVWKRREWSLGKEGRVFQNAIAELMLRQRVVHIPDVLASGSRETQRHNIHMPVSHLKHRQ